MAKIISGRLDQDGTILSGTGFKCDAWGGAGVYVIFYDEPFKEPPVVVATVEGPEWETYNLSTSVVHNEPGISVICTSSQDRTTRSGFMFIATGE